MGRILNGLKKLVGSQEADFTAEEYDCQEYDLDSLVLDEDQFDELVAVSSEEEVELTELLLCVAAQE